MQYKFIMEYFIKNKILLQIYSLDYRYKLDFEKNPSHWNYILETECILPIA